MTITDLLASRLLSGILSLTPSLIFTLAGIWRNILHPPNEAPLHFLPSPPLLSPLSLRHIMSGYSDTSTQLQHLYKKQSTLTNNSV